MLATLRADFYRLFKTKGFWIAQGFIITFIFVSISGQSIGSIGVEDSISSEQTQEAFSIAWTGVTSVNAMSYMMSFFFYCMLPLLVIIVGHDFTKQTYKNILTVGISRTKYFFSQYISFLMIILLQVFYVYIVSFLTGTLFYGAGEDLNLNQVKEWLFVGAVQFLMITAIMTLSCLVIYLTKNNVLAILSAILFPIFVTLANIFFSLDFIQFFDFQNILTDSEFILSGSKELWQSIGTALMTIIVLLSVTVWKFDKVEL